MNFHFLNYEPIFKAKGALMRISDGELQIIRAPEFTIIQILAAGHTLTLQSPDFIPAQIIVNFMQIILLPLVNK